MPTPVGVMLFLYLLLSVPLLQISAEPFQHVFQQTEASIKDIVVNQTGKSNSTGTVNYGRSIGKIIADSGNSETIANGSTTSNNGLAGITVTTKSTRRNADSIWLVKNDTTVSGTTNDTSGVRRLGGVGKAVLVTERLRFRKGDKSSRSYLQGNERQNRPSVTNFNNYHRSQRPQYSQYPQQQQQNLQSNRFPELPDCSTQQVCNALFLRINLTHPLCRCPSSSPSSTTLQHCPDNKDAYDGHTMQLSTASLSTRSPMTLLKTCQPLSEYRSCRQPRDWTLLALQNVRTGRSHYLILCRCPIWATLEGPVAHRNPPYADLPGIRVYGMLCWTGNRGSRFQNKDPPPVPWEEVSLYTKNMKIL